MSDLIEGIANICVILVCMLNLTTLDIHGRRLEHLEERLDRLDRLDRTDHE